MEWAVWGWGSSKKLVELWVLEVSSSRGRQDGGYGDRPDGTLRASVSFSAPCPEVELSQQVGIRTTPDTSGYMSDGSCESPGPI